MTNPNASHRTIILATCLAAIQMGLANRASAQSLFGSNAYMLVFPSNPFTGNNNSWGTASAAAAASTYSGIHGHLATITSAAENAFLLSLSANPPGFNGAWIGGKSPEGWLEGPETGQAFSYTNWGGSEPNNAGYAYMNIGTFANGIPAGQWADDSGIQGVPDPNFDPVIGYFVEYENVVPEPMSLTVFAAAGLALLGKRRPTRRTRH